MKTSQTQVQSTIAIPASDAGNPAGFVNEVKSGAEALDITKDFRPHILNRRAARWARRDR